VEEFKEVQRALQQKRNSEIVEGASEISKLLSASNKILNVPRASPPWRLYVEYVNEIVMEGFSKAILVSVAYLNEQVNPKPYP
jgi:dynein heavy chain